MRVLILAALALAACSPAPTVETPAEAPSAAPAVELDLPTGELLPMSGTAEAITGTLTAALPGPVLRMGLGLVYETQSAELPAPEALIARGASDRFGQIFPLAGEGAPRRYALLRVTSVSGDATAPNGGLCGPQSVSYIALAHDAGGVHMAAFAGADAPGPDAADSALCAMFSYAPAAP